MEGESRGDVNPHGDVSPHGDVNLHGDVSPRTQPEPKRVEGDGSPRPSSLDESKRNPQRGQAKPFSIKFEVDVIQLVLTITAMATRFWLLGLPRAVVFDELHFAKFASLYMKKIFFFDVHPPLGKMLLALVCGFCGFDGDANFNRIGEDYPVTFPVYQLRMLPALLGSLTVPLAYQIAVELRLSRWAALLAGACVLLDNALLTQSRFMLMEGMMVFFLCLSIFSFLKFRNLAHREFSIQWWFWLCLTGVTCTCTLSIKYVGFYTALVILTLMIQDYWRMLADIRISDLHLVKHLLVRILAVVFMPLVIYVSLFYVHLTTLTKAGPHDNVMTSGFQASLEGGLAALTKGQPLHVSYGSQITLRLTHGVVAGKPCWLHSHQHVYPVRYPDGRGSSHQQQVTCYLFKDVYNWWIVKHPARESLVVDDPPQPVKHGDVVQLVHGITSRALNSHDVAAPMTPQNQEVSCYIDYNVSMPAQNYWRVEIDNRDNDEDTWQTIKSHVRFVHTDTRQALKATGKQLPEWGFHQIEVATDRVVVQPGTVWNVEEHRFTTSPEKEQQARELASTEMIPLKPTHLSFWTKFFELQTKMLFSRSDIDMEHKYSSGPLDWPFLTKNTAYWMSSTSNAQIHLLGNPVIWYSASLSLFIYLGLLLIYMMRRRRDIFDLTESEWLHFVFIGELLIGGYFCHYLPFFLTDRTLFMHSYLPCLIYKILSLAAVVDHIYIISHRFVYAGTTVSGVCLGLVASMVWAFWKLAVFSYGNANLKPEDIQSLTWKDTWDFLVHTNH